MDDNFTNQELIERYLDDEMSGKERKTFEEQLETDTELYRELQIIKDIRSAAQPFGEKHIKNKLDKVVEKLEGEQFFEQTHRQIRQKNKFNYKLLIPLIIALLAAGAFFLYQKFSSQTTTPPSKYADYFTPEKEKLLEFRDELSAIGLADPSRERKQLLISGLNAFDEEKYQEAETLLADYVRTYPEDSISVFYLALSKMELEKLAEARNLLESLDEKPNFILDEETNWYLSLNYLLLSEQEKEGSYKSNARSLLLELADDEDARYQDQAKQLLDVVTQ